MTKLGDKIKLALDESRMLILGAQVLLGFQYRADFEHGFDLLPRAAQYAKLVALTTLLMAIALIICPARTIGLAGKNLERSERLLGTRKAAASGTG